MLNQNNQTHPSLSDLIREQQKSNHLLQNMAQTQQEILVVERKSLSVRRWKLVTMTIKFLVVLWFMWVGFGQMKAFTSDLFEKFSSPKNMIGQITNLAGGNMPDIKKLDNRASEENLKGLDLNKALNSLSQLQGLLGQ